MSGRRAAKAPTAVASAIALDVAPAGKLSPDDEHRLAVEAAAAAQRAEVFHAVYAQPMDLPSIMQGLFRRVVPAPRSVRTLMVHDKYVPLNPSRSKNLVVGMDIARGFRVSAVIENGSGKAGVRLDAEDFRMLFEPRFAAMVNKHMVKPYDMPGPSRQGQNVDVRCVLLNDNAPALKVSTPDGNYSLLGSITWETLQQVSGYVQSLIFDMEGLLSNDLPCWIAMFMSNMVFAAQKSGHSKFETEKAAGQFLNENAEAWFQGKKPPSPYAEILKELFAKHPETCSRVLYDALADNIITGVE